WGDHLAHPLGPDRFSTLDHSAQDFGHLLFALLRRQFQQLQILALGSFVRSLLQLVISQPKDHSRIETRSKSVALKYPGLFDQRMDDVTIIDRRLAFAAQPFHLFNQLPGIPDLHMIRVDADIHSFSDQLARHGVMIMTNHNRAVAADSLRLFAVSVKMSLGQRPQRLEIFRHSIAPPFIASREQLPQEFAILFARREFAAAAQDQFLLDSSFESMMRLLDVAVLVTAAGR